MNTYADIDLPRAAAGLSNDRGGQSAVILMLYHLQRTSCCCSFSIRKLHIAIASVGSQKPGIDPFFHIALPEGLLETTY